MLEGEHATFSADASHATSARWQTSVDEGASWTDRAGQTSRTLQVGPVTAEKDGTLYRVVFTGAAGTVGTAAATLSVWVAPGALLQVTPRAGLVDRLPDW